MFFLLNFTSIFRVAPLSLQPSQLQEKVQFTHLVERLIIFGFASSALVAAWIMRSTLNGTSPWCIVGSELQSVLLLLCLLTLSLCVSLLHRHGGEDGCRLLGQWKSFFQGNNRASSPPLLFTNLVKCAPNVCRDIERSVAASCCSVLTVQATGFDETLWSQAKKMHLYSPTPSHWKKIKYICYRTISGCIWVVLTEIQQV